MPKTGAKYQTLLVVLQTFSTGVKHQGGEFKWGPLPSRASSCFASRRFHLPELSRQSSLVEVSALHRGMIHLEAVVSVASLNPSARCCWTSSKFDYSLHFSQQCLLYQDVNTFLNPSFKFFPLQVNALFRISWVTPMNRLGQFNMFGMKYELHILPEGAKVYICPPRKRNSSRIVAKVQILALFTCPSPITPELLLLRSWSQNMYLLRYLDRISRLHEM